MSSVSERRQAAVVAGHRGDVLVARTASYDPEPTVRVVGFGALARSGGFELADVLRGLADADSVVVRRVIELAAVFEALETAGDAEVDSALLGLLAGETPSVAEAAAWSLGERHQAHENEIESGDRSFPEPPAVVDARVVAALSEACVSHSDALVREASAAALGAIGDRGGLAAILVATKDVATVRRRAVLALASFDGLEVFDALTVARIDRDWQVRQAAEDLLQSWPDATE
jgi:HEAT repeat protein